MNPLFAPYFNLLDQRNPLSYLAAVVFLFVVLVVIRFVRRRRGFRLRALLRLVFRKSVWLHKSSRLDYRLYLVNMPLMAFILAGFTIGSGVSSEIAASVLTAGFGAPAVTVSTNWAVIALITVVLIAALDLGYWLSHTWMHRSAILWEFHKVHHSAEVMTPATEFRQHPLELVLIPCAMGITTGVAFAVMKHWFGTGAVALGHGGYNMLVFVHIFTFHHLRHSHINMPFPGPLSRLLHSPAHHLIHHSTNPAHHGRNMGYILSVWDWAFGTLYVPRRGERLTLGIGPEGASHDSVVNAFWLPFRNAGMLIARRWRGAVAARLGG